VRHQRIAKGKGRKKRREGKEKRRRRRKRVLQVVVLDLFGEDLVLGGVDDRREDESVEEAQPHEMPALARARRLGVYVLAHPA
jgi:hypothetical protein